MYDGGVSVYFVCLMWLDRIISMFAELPRYDRGGGVQWQVSILVKSLTWNTVISPVSG